MKYYATVLEGYTFKQLRQLDEGDLFQFDKFLYDYPLIFVEVENSIIFFNMFVNLDKVEYAFLYALVKDATEKNTEKGLDIISLWELAGCSHMEKKSKNNDDEKKRKGNRLRSIQSKILEKILNNYNKLLKKQKTRIEKIANERFLSFKKDREELNKKEQNDKYKLSKDQEEQYKKTFLEEVKNEYPSVIGIVFDNIQNQKTFLNDYVIDSTSPYNNIDLDSALKILIQTPKFDGKKYTTDFVFRY